MKSMIVSTRARKYISDENAEFGKPYRAGGKWYVYVFVRHFEIEVSALTPDELEDMLRYVTPLTAAQRVYDSLSIADQITFGDRPHRDRDYVEVIPAKRRDETAAEIRGLRRDLRSMAEAFEAGMSEAMEAQRPTVPTMPTIQQPQPQAPVQPDPLQQLQLENAQLQQQIAGMGAALQKMTEQLAYLQGQIDATKQPPATDQTKK